MNENKEQYQLRVRILKVLLIIVVIVALIVIFQTKEPSYRFLFAFPFGFICLTILLTIDVLRRWRHGGEIPHYSTEKVLPDHRASRDVPQGEKHKSDKLRTSGHAEADRFVHPHEIKNETLLGLLLSDRSVWFVMLLVLLLIVFIIKTWPLPLWIEGALLGTLVITGIIGSIIIKDLLESKKAKKPINRTRMILGLGLLNGLVLLAVVLYSIFSVTCNSPYIKVGRDCCLDQNVNGVCDQDQRSDSAENIANELVLDAEPADGGSLRTQNEWIQYWSAVKDGRRFASAADMYIVFKQLKAISETGTPQQREHAAVVLTSLRNDWENGKQITSTRIIYSPAAWTARIIQNYDPTDLQSDVSLEIPEWPSVSIPEVLQDRRGLPYLRAYFGTRDSAEEIAATLEYVGGKPRKQIQIWTPPMDWRTEARMERAARFGLWSDGFYVEGGIDHVVFGYGGRSRGIR